MNITFLQINSFQKLGKCESAVKKVSFQTRKYLCSSYVSVKGNNEIIRNASGVWIFQGEPEWPPGIATANAT